MINLGLNHRKPSSQSYAPPIKDYLPLSNGSQFDHAEVFNSDGKIVSISAILVTI